MNKLAQIIVVMAFISSFASAAPLMDTKQDVLKTNFCKKYKCKPDGKAKSSQYAQWTDYYYKLSVPGLVTVTRTSSNTILSVNITFNGIEEFTWIYGHESYFLKEFAVMAMGRPSGTSFKESCLDSFVLRGHGYQNIVSWTDGDVLVICNGSFPKSDMDQRPLFVSMKIE